MKLDANKINITPLNHLLERKRKRKETQMLREAIEKAEAKEGKGGKTWRERHRVLLAWLWL